MIDKIARKYDGQPGGGMRLPPMGGPPSESAHLATAELRHSDRLLLISNPVSQCANSDLLAVDSVDLLVDIRVDLR